MPVCADRLAMGSCWCRQLPAKVYSVYLLKRFLAELIVLLTLHAAQGRPGSRGGGPSAQPQAVVFVVEPDCLPLRERPLSKTKMTAEPNRPAADCDVSVLILFFNRPEPLARVFEAVRQARPARLFLYQDGPRGEQDTAGIEACRRVVEGVDWQCTVHRNYQAVNAGCNPSNYNAQRWAFTLTDKCIVLEDDSIPSQSFFPFCKELLDRYAEDERIVMISGFNSEERIDSPYDYTFTHWQAIWGWATWRRVVQAWDPTYAWMDDAYALQQVRALVKRRGMSPHMLRAAADHRSTGHPYYATLLWSTIVLQNGLAIAPTRNMVTNLGAVPGSVHYSSDLDTMPRRVRRMFTMPAYYLQGPLRHPPYVIEDVAYTQQIYRTYALGHPWIKVGRSLEELWLNLIRGRFGVIGKALRQRVRKWMGLVKHV